MRRHLTVLGILAALAGCGSNPTGPKPTPTPTPEPVVSYAGTWTGTYRITACTNSGFFADSAFCANVQGTNATVGFTFTQTDRAVAATFQLGSIGFPGVNSSVAADGSLSFSSALTTGTFPIDASWVLRRPTTTSLTGQTQQVWKAVGQPGEGVLNGEIVSVVKTAAALR